MREMCVAPDSRLKVNTSSMPQFGRETGQGEGVRLSIGDTLGAMPPACVTPSLSMKFTLTDRKPPALASARSFGAGERQPRHQGPALAGPTRRGFRETEALPRDGNSTH